MCVKQQMSTGDQSAYIRSKLAERGGPPARFMKDGFDKWAESSIPARSGQMDKVPAEATGASYGGAMTVSQAKQLHKRIGSKASHLFKKMTHLGEMFGGANRKIWGIELSNEMNNAADWAEKLSNGFLEISKFYDKFMKDLDKQIITNTDYTQSTNKDELAVLEFAKTLKAYFEKWKKLMGLLTKIAEFISKNLNQPPPPPGDKTGTGLHGGATWQETWETFKRTVEKYYNDIKDLFKWLYANRVPAYALLRNLDSLQPTGTTVADVLEAIFGKPEAPKPGDKPADKPAGSGMYGGINLALIARINQKHSRGSSKMSGGKHCMCEHSHSSSPMGGRKHGGAMVQDYTPMPYGPGPSRKVGGRKHGGAMVQDYTPMPAMVQDYTPMPYGPMGGRKHGGRKHGGAKQTTIMEMAPTRGISGMVGGPGYDEGPEGPPTGPAGFGKGGASCGGRKPSARGEIVKKVMREQGLSLPQASKYVKEHGLY